MNSLISSSDLVIKNRFFGEIQKNWNHAYTHAKFQLKGLRPVKFIYASQDQLILNKAHLLSPKFYKDHPTKFKLHIRNKGERRIYVGINILGYKWDPELGIFIRNDFGKCRRYYFVEIDSEPVVVILDKLLDLHSLPG